MSELKLALGYAVAGTAAHMHHVVGVKHAQLLLPTREAGDLVAEAGCTVAVFRTQHEEVRMLQGAHTMHAQIPETEKNEQKLVPCNSLYLSFSVIAVISHE